MSTVKDSLKETGKPLLLAFGLLLATVFGLILTKNGKMNMPTNITRKTYTQPQQVLQEGVNYTAIIKTNMGDIEIDLLENETPVAVNSFIFLAKEKFFNEVIFHRVVKGFVIQGGDPTGTGTGGPGYSFQDETNKREYTKYSVGMANSGPNSNGSQFFIVTGTIQDANLGALNSGQYTLFGEVKNGKNVVDAIENIAVDSNDKPNKPVVIQSVEILQN